MNDRASEPARPLTSEAVVAGASGYLRLIRVLAATVAGIDHLSGEYRQELSPGHVLLAVRQQVHRLIEAEKLQPFEADLLKQAMFTFAGIVDDYRWRGGESAGPDS